MDLFATLQNKYSLKFQNGFPCNIGFGISGPVQLAINNHTKQQVAVKKISKKNNSQEIEILKKMKHPSIIKYLDSYVSLETSINFIVMEYLPNGTLFQLINKKGIEDKNKIDTIFKAICQGVEYMHSLGITHCDIKPQNILLDKYFNPKICDFGSATLSRVHSTACGSYQYMAPQMLLQKQYTNRIDIWSLGILFFQMIHGRPPYLGHSFEQILEKINNPILFSENFRQRQISLIKRILKINPDQRPKICEIIANIEENYTMKNSVQTTLNISSYASKKSKSKFISLRDINRRQQKPQIKITNIKLLGKKNYLQQFCENAKETLKELCSQKLLEHYHCELVKKGDYQKSRQLSKNTSKISLKKIKLYHQRQINYI